MANTERRDGGDTGSGEDMHVLKRNGEREIVAFDKILARLKTLGKEAGITAYGEF